MKILTANVRADANDCCNYGNQLEHQGQDRFLKENFFKKYKVVTRAEKADELIKSGYWR